MTSWMTCFVGMVGGSQIFGSLKSVLGPSGVQFKESQNLVVFFLFLFHLDVDAVLGGSSHFLDARFSRETRQTYIGC